MRHPSSELIEHFNRLEFGQPTSSNTLERCSLLATAEARVAAEDWAWDLAHGIRTATERQVAWVRSQEEPDKRVGEQIPPAVLAEVDERLSPAAASITAVFESVGGFPLFAPKVSHRIIQYLAVADIYDVTAEIGEANQLQPIFEAGVLPVGWDCEEDDDPNEVGFPQVWAPWTSCRPALQPWFGYGRPLPIAKKPTFKAYRAACEKAWTKAGLPETDVDRMSELLTREARERRVQDDTPVQRDMAAGPDALPATGPTQVETADFMTTAEVDAVLAPSWDDGPRAVAQIMEAADWKRQSISTENSVITRPRRRDPLRMLLSKGDQLNGVLITEKPQDGDFQRLADRMTGVVTKALGAHPAGGEAAGKPTWEVPGRTITVVRSSTTVDLTIVRNGTKPFVEQQRRFQPPKRRMG